VGRGRHRPGAGAPAGSSASGWRRTACWPKDTHGSTVRLAPPLVISQADLEHALDAFAAALRDLGGADR
jgi:4-aminobutyrate aminotransferase-like enzyme